MLWTQNRGVIIFAVLICLAIAACFLFTYWQVDVSQHHWCDALNTLTLHPEPKPVDPSANPAREEGFVLSQEFIKLKGEFGCG
jgi:hypothetical protein